MAAKAGEVHSIRLPPGTAHELRTLTGQKVSTVARQQILAVIAAAKLAQAKEKSK